MLIAFPYIFSTSALFILYLYGNYKKIYKKESVIISLFYLVIFFGFRGYIFNDTFAYKAFFDRIPDIRTSIKIYYSLWSWYEPGFSYYCSLIKVITRDYFVYQFIDTLVNFILLYKALEWFDSNNSLSYMVAFVAGGLSLFIETQRNTKAILIFFLSLRYIYNRCLIKYLLCCFIAVTFHATSIIFFPLYIFLKIKYSKIVLVFIFLISMIFFVFGSNVIRFIFSIVTPFLPRDIAFLVSYYTSDNYAYSIQRKISLGFIEKIVTFCALFIGYNKIYKGKMIIAMNVFIVYFLCYFIFSSSIEVSFRLSLIFAFSYWILWQYLIHLFKTKHIKEVFLMCLLVYGILKSSLYNHPHQKYENILFGASTRNERLRILLQKEIPNNL